MNCVLDLQAPRYSPTATAYAWSRYSSDRFAAEVCDQGGPLGTHESASRGLESIWSCRIDYHTHITGSMLCVCTRVLGCKHSSLERCFKVVEFSCVVCLYGFQRSRQGSHPIWYTCVRVFFFSGTWPLPLGQWSWKPSFTKSHDCPQNLFIGTNTCMHAIMHEMYAC